MMKLIELRGPHAATEDYELTCSAWRLRVALFLRRASAVLAQLATQITRLRRRSRGRPELEFYAEAGAPEGALYLDGRLIGTLPGITRL